MQALPITVDETRLSTVRDGVLSPARDQKLSTYDAAYLEPAMREGFPIATRDEMLLKAARRCGVPVK